MSIPIPSFIEEVRIHILAHRCICLCRWEFDHDMINDTYTIIHDDNPEHTHTFAVYLPQEPQCLPVVHNMIEWCHQVTARCPQMRVPFDVPIRWSEVSDGNPPTD